MPSLRAAPSRWSKNLHKLLFSIGVAALGAMLGSSPAAARRAARIADDWFPPLDARLWAPYREECIKLGKADPGTYPRQGPIFLWIAEDPDKAWEQLLPHVSHQLQSYAQWTE